MQSAWQLHLSFMNVNAFPATVIGGYLQTFPSVGVHLKLYAYFQLLLSFVQIYNNKKCFHFSPFIFLFLGLYFLIAHRAFKPQDLVPPALDAIVSLVRVFLYFSPFLSSCPICLSMEQCQIRNPPLFAFTLCRKFIICINPDSYRISPSNSDYHFLSPLIIHFYISLIPQFIF